MSPARSERACRAVPLKALHEAGVIIIPGTDSMPGYELHHELELYVRPGIPAPEVLRMATLVMKGGKTYDPARVEQALGITATAHEAL